MRTITRQDFWDLKEEVEKLRKEIDKIKGIPKCPLCKSDNIIKRGFRNTINRGRVQKYQCTECGYKFSNYNNKEYHMRENKFEISKALRLRKKGLTLSQIASEMGNKVTRQTVHRWLHKFQEPNKEIIVKRKMKNQFGEYERRFKIKV